MSMPAINSTPSWMVWTGRVISVLPVLMLILSGVMKFNMSEENAKNTAQMGWNPNIMPALAVFELSATFLYILPPTAVVGAILLTGYLGGAVATHVRVGEYSHSVIPMALGVLIWVGLYLRDHRIRLLTPLRRFHD